MSDIKNPLPLPLDTNQFFRETRIMKRKAVHKKPVHTSRSSHRRVAHKEDERYLVIVRSWVFMVLFAIMLGVGVMVGSYINNQLNGGAPVVAGASTQY